MGYRGGKARGRGPGGFGADQICDSKSCCTLRHYRVAYCFCAFSVIKVEVAQMESTFLLVESQVGEWLWGVGVGDGIRKVFSGYVVTIGL